MARPHLNDRPPEQQRTQEEAGMFHLVPALRTQTQFVEARQMPKNNSERHRAKSEDGADQYTTEVS
jgi:hypothetical protein